MSARTRKPPAQEARAKFAPLLEMHLDVLRDTVSRFLSSPLSSIMTVFVISIALLLPALLQILGHNLSQVNEQFRQSARITLYLEDTVTLEQGREVSDRLSARSDIGESRYLSKDQALEEFSSSSGFGATILLLEDNPLPASILVTPADSSMAEAQQLYEELEQLPGIELAQIDLEWVQRLEAFRAIVERTGFIFSLILGLAVVFIVGNTIRLGIESRRSEIQVIQLVGGSNSFIARPFLYTGTILGATGALLTCILILLIHAGFSRVLDNLLALYGAEFTLQGYSLLENFILLLLGAGLGWGGAMISTYQQLLGGEE